jgi:hypothetical protein
VKGKSWNGSSPKSDSEGFFASHDATWLLRCSISQHGSQRLLMPICAPASTDQSSDTAFASTARNVRAHTDMRQLRLRRFPVTAPPPFLESGGLAAMGQGGMAAPEKGSATR